MGGTQARAQVTAIHAGACHETDPSLLLIALMPALAQAQVPTADPTATRSATAWPRRRWHPATSGPAAAAGAAVAAAHAADQVHRSGPGRARPAPKPADKVYDRNGRIVPGSARGPNRVFDSRTGRYYDSVPAGDGQQIKR